MLRGSPESRRLDRAPSVDRVCPQCHDLPSAPSRRPWVTSHHSSLSRRETLPYRLYRRTHTFATGLGRTQGLPCFRLPTPTRGWQTVAHPGAHLPGGATGVVVGKKHYPQGGVSQVVSLVHRTIPCQKTDLSYSCPVNSPSLHAHSPYLSYLTVKACCHQPAVNFNRRGVKPNS